MSVFGDRLLEARKRQHITQIELADKIGMSRSAVGGYEKEGKDASFEALVRIVRALGVTSDYLLGIDDSAGWMGRAHIAETFYDLELLYDRAEDAQKPQIDAILGEVDAILNRLMHAPEGANLRAVYNLVRAVRMLVVNDDAE